MSNRNIIVIGASAGGFEALQGLVAGLPPDLPASIFIVWHMSPEVTGILPQVLNKYNTLRASNAVDGAPIEQGRIYIAPPDRHMLLEEGRVRVTRGPKENRFRPAVDPLFRSAAYTYGARVIGIILSGALDDGTAGLWMVKHFGGTAIVQQPGDAAVRAMPENALREVAVDHTVPVSEMAALVVRLCREPISDNPQHPISTMEDQKRTEQEIRVAKGDKVAGEEIIRFGELTPYACPECHGVLFALRDGEITRYRCHTGHAYSTDSLLSSVTENIDNSLWNVIRGMEESIMMLNNTGDLHAERNNTKLAAQYFKKAQETAERLKVLQEMAAHTEQLSRERINDEDDV